jgi:hypothetical protein
MMIELQESHYIPAGLYRGSKRKKVTIFSDSGAIEEPEQVKDYLLCSECEQRFGQRGESEVLRAIAAKAGKAFPLHERLSEGEGFLVKTEDLTYFSGPSVGLDMDHFAYFALSVAWRGAVHAWRFPDGETVSSLDLGEFREPLRRYLLGEAGLPRDIVVLVLVMSDAESRQWWLLPTPIHEDNCLNIRFHARGVFFRIMLGRDIPQVFRNHCCTGPDKLLAYGNGERRIHEATCRFLPQLISHSS